MVDKGWIDSAEFISAKTAKLKHPQIGVSTRLLSVAPCSAEAASVQRPLRITAALSTK